MTQHISRGSAARNIRRQNAQVRTQLRITELESQIPKLEGTAKLVAENKLAENKRVLANTDKALNPKKKEQPQPLEIERI
jgi:hypothetical protein